MKERRYKCIQCFDTGRVEVWHYERVNLAKRDGVEVAKQCPNKTTSAACNCKLGEKFSTRPTSPLITFDPSKHCLAKHGDVESERVVMIILALDPAASTGWAHSNGQFGVWPLQLQDASLGDQHVQLEKYLERAITTMGCDVIATENAGFGSPNPEMQARHNERLGIIRLVAARHGLKVQAFQPSSIKLFATGDGHARKPAMVAAVKRHYGIAVTSDDEADAICILELMKRPDCWPDSAKGIRKKKTRKKVKGATLFD